MRAMDARWKIPAGTRIANKVTLGWYFRSSPNGIRTRVSTLRGWPERLHKLESNGEIKVHQVFSCLRPPYCATPCHSLVARTCTQGSGEPRTRIPCHASRMAHSCGPPSSSARVRRLSAPIDEPSPPGRPVRRTDVLKAIAPVLQTALPRHRLNAPVAAAASRVYWPVQLSPNDRPRVRPRGGDVPVVSASPGLVPDRSNRNRRLLAAGLNYDHRRVELSNLEMPLEELKYRVLKWLKSIFQGDFTSFHKCNSNPFRIMPGTLRTWHRGPPNCALSGEQSRALRAASWDNRDSQTDWHSMMMFAIEWHYERHRWQYLGPFERPF